MSLRRNEGHVREPGDFWDAPLTSTGEEQAASLKQKLLPEKVDLVVSSWTKLSKRRKLQRLKYPHVKIRQRLCQCALGIKKLPE